MVAYASLRADPHGTWKSRFDWENLVALPDGDAKAYVRSLLATRPLTAADGAGRTGAASKRTAAGTPQDKGFPDNLNPIQMQLLKEIARRVREFGSEVVTEEAIAAWERSNARQIVSIRAAVTSLESEMEKQEYVESMRAMAGDPFKSSI